MYVCTYVSAARISAPHTGLLMLLLPPFTTTSRSIVDTRTSSRFVRRRVEERKLGVEELGKLVMMTYFDAAGRSPCRAQRGLDFNRPFSADAVRLNGSNISSYNYSK